MVLYSGSVPESFAMMDSITSSAPPPIDSSLRSLENGNGDM